MSLPGSKDSKQADGDGAGTGFSNPATEAHLIHPPGVAVDRDGNVHIADRRNACIRRVDAATGTIAKLGYATGMAVGSNGNVYVADIQNHRVRVLKPHSAVAFGGCN